MAKIQTLLLLIVVVLLTILVTRKNEVQTVQNVTHDVERHDTERQVVTRITTVQTQAGVSEKADQTPPKEDVSKDQSDNDNDTDWSSCFLSEPFTTDQMNFWTRAQIEAADEALTECANECLNTARDCVIGGTLDDDYKCLCKTKEMFNGRRYVQKFVRLEDVKQDGNPSQVDAQ